MNWRPRSQIEREMGNWTEIPPGSILYGTFDDVYFPGYRPGYAWRCGDCIMAGVNYTSARTACRGAEAHRDKEHPGSTVRAVAS
jgi:hypothetical protein